MKTTLTQIGNSKGIIIPSTLLKQCDFGDEVLLEIRKNGIMIKRIDAPRQGWAESVLAAGEPDDLLLGDFPNDFDETEWVWEE